MATIHNEEHQRLASAKIVAAAQGILSGESGIVAAARQLSRLRFEVGAEDDPDFLFFVGVDSETDHLPVGEVRARWSSDALKAKDGDLQTYETRIRERAFQVCRNLIRKYDTRGA